MRCVVSLSQENALKKAQLLMQNTLYIPSTIKLPLPFGKSTAGPCTDAKTITLKFNNSQIKMQVSKQPQNRFVLQQQETGYTILEYDQPFLENVKVIPNYYHAPNQVFLNIADSCIHQCSFCSLAKKQPKNTLLKKQLFNIIDKNSNDESIHGFAFTGGVFPHQQDHIETLTQCISKVRKKNTDIPIGVEPTIQQEKEIKQLYEAGATEIKINIQMPTKELYTKVCPGLSYDKQFDFLQYAVDLFGKGKVTSNIIFGCGESDAEIISSIETLTESGVVPTLRLLRIHPRNKEYLSQQGIHTVNSTPERMYQLAKQQKTILQHHGLTTTTFHTMCHACGCCDLVPFKDF